VKHRLAYENGPHALKALMLLQGYGGHITKIPEKMITLHGDSYYFVEVTSKEGTRYVIEAYGGEAIELEREASGGKTETETREKLLLTA
jgi:hypothetical protein